MKKILFYIATVVAIAFAFSACQKLTNSETESSTIVCRTPSETKAYAEEIDVLWQADDIIYVVDRYAPVPSGSEPAPLVYTLKTGVGTKEATFEYDGEGFAPGQDIVAFHFTYYGKVFGKYYYDMPHTPTLYGYDATTPASANTMRVPMMAIGRIGEPLNFTHLASMVRISLTNALGADETITGISLEVDSNDIGARVQVNPGEWTTELYKSSGCTNITTSGASVIIEDTKTKTFDFIVQPGTYSGFTMRIQTNSGEYRYRKPSFTASVGTIHTFNTSLSSGALRTADYSISIDGKPAVDYDLSLNPTLPSTATTSIKVTPNTLTEINSTRFATIIGNLPSGKVISVDLSELEYISTSWNVPFKHNDSIGDLYLPDNVTRLKGYAMAAGSSNCKLHISKNVAFIDYIIFNESSRDLLINEGCGFVVDPESTYFSSDAGILYNYAGTSLLNRPSFASDAGGIVVKEGVTSVNTYALSNSNYPSVVFPSTLTTFGSSVFYNTKLLKTITFKSVTPPSGLAANLGNLPTVEDPDVGLIIIDTGDDDQDNTSKAAYISAASTSLPAGWIIKTKADPLPE